MAFHIGYALAPPFEDAKVEAAYKNDLFTHLTQNAVRAIKEVYQRLKPGCFFAARDVDADSVVWGNPSDSIKQLDKLFIARHHSRGRDITIGKQLPAILRQAGFRNTLKSASADTKSGLEATRAHARITLFLLDGPFGRDIAERDGLIRARSSV